MYDIYYHPKVLSHDLPKIGKSDLMRIRTALETKLQVKPELYGIPLRGELRSYFKLRTGDYRTVYKISNRSVFVLVIANRKDVYEIAGQRS